MTLGRSLVGFAVALGIGLLIGAERERRKSQTSTRSAAGIRTFAIGALAGAVGLEVGGVAGFLAVAAITGVLVAISAWAGRSSDDPGITTELALVLTVVLGALATHAPGLAGMAGVATAILLAARTPLHRFVGSVLTEREVRDGLILAGATLIVLPLVPDQTLGPYQVVNPRSVWILVILVLSVSAAGHVAVRLVGARYGLPLAGLLGGFVSSAATIGAMGARAKSTPAELPAAAAAAVLSTVATMLQMALVLGATSEVALQAAAPSLMAGGGVAIAYSLLSTLQAIRRRAPAPAGDGGAFSLKSALVFAATVALVLLLAAASRARFGEAGLVLAAAVAGLADAHAAAISVASLVATGQLGPDEALVPILLGLSTNTFTKLVLAASTGGRPYLRRVGPGLILLVLAIWTPAVVGLRPGEVGVAMRPSPPRCSTCGPGTAGWRGIRRPTRLAAGSASARRSRS